MKVELNFDERFEIKWLLEKEIEKEQKEIIEIIKNKQYFENISESYQNCINRCEWLIKKHTERINNYQKLLKKLGGIEK